MRKKLIRLLDFGRGGIARWTGVLRLPIKRTDEMGLVFVHSDCHGCGNEAGPVHVPTHCDGHAGFDFGPKVIRQLLFLRLIKLGAGLSESAEGSMS